MPVYWISYRLERDGDYDQRYKDLVDAIDAASTSEWQETTSFHIVESDLTAQNLARTLKVGLDPARDRLLVRRMDGPHARYFGKFSDLKTLLALMPYALPA